MLPIALDAMGGDHAPQEIVQGAVAAVQEAGLNVLLVGRQEEMEACLSSPLPPRLTLVHAPDVIGFDESPTQAVQQKPLSSISVGLRLVAEGNASAFVSAGATGAVLSGAFLQLGTLEGIERPALSVYYSIPGGGPCLLLDVGANADCRPSFLLQFARLGCRYMERVQGIQRPTVGLLSNGTEEGKGSRLVKESYALLQQSELNFVGNAEGTDLYTGHVQVMVTDGFTGNVLLKATEGLAETLLGQLAQVVKNGLKYPEAKSFMATTLEAFKQRMDYSEYGGAVLLGVRGNVVVAHGRSRARAVGNALRLAQQMVVQGMPQTLIGGDHGQADSG
ncbi:MAG: phosphate acyltransferase PlsX [Chloroflexota bacterium]